MFFGLNDVAFLGGVQPPTPLLLDLYPNAAAAYSLRQLRTGVTNVVRVRRSSNSTEADFTAAQVSDGSLAAWVGAGNNGFVRTWYDQSGNGNHAEQSTMVNQPSIVQNGSLITESALPSLDFNGDTQRLETTLTGYTESTTFCVARGRTESRNGRIFGFGQEHSVGTFGLNGSWGFFRSTVNISSLTGFAWLNRTLVYLQYRQNLGSVLAGNGGTGLGFTHNSSVAIGALTIGDSGFVAECGDALIQELVYYQENQSTNRAAIEANINTHYAIY